MVRKCLMLTCSVCNNSKVKSILTSLDSTIKLDLFCIVLSISCGVKLANMSLFSLLLLLRGMRGANRDEEVFFEVLSTRDFLRGLHVHVYSNKKHFADLSNPVQYIQALQQWETHRNYHCNAN